MLPTIQSLVDWQPHDPETNKNLQYLTCALLSLFVAIFILKTVHNVFLHPLASVPGPLLGKVFAAYMTPAQASLHRAQVCNGSYTSPP